MKHPLQKPLLYLLTSSCQKTPSFSDARESDLFRERSRLFELEFWNKKNSLTRADGGRRSSLYDDRYHSDESFWNTLLLRGALRLSRMRFVSFLKRFFSRVASRKLITVVFFFLFSLVFPQFHKTSQFRRRQTHFARAKAKDGRRKRPPTKVPISRSLMIKHDNNNGDKNNENARSSALPYLVVCTKKSCFKFMCTFSRGKHVGPSFGNTKKTRTNFMIL
jgi:hypothetical protein